MPTLNICILGPAAVGKTCAAHKWATGKNVEKVQATSGTATYVRDDFHANSMDWKVEITEIGSELFKSSQKSPPECLSAAQVIILMHSVIDPSTLEQLRDTFVPYCRQHALHTPILVVGSRSGQVLWDTIINELKEKGITPVSREAGKAFAQSIGADQYFQCDGVTEDGLKQVFEKACSVAASVWQHKAPKDRNAVKYDLEVSLVDGVVYEAYDSNGLADPFVKIKQNGHVVWTSSVQKKSLLPSWKEKEIVKEGFSAGQHFSFLMELWDKDLVKHDFIGSFTLEGVVTDHVREPIKFHTLGKTGEKTAEINFGYGFVEHRD